MASLTLWNKNEEYKFFKKTLEIATLELSEKKAEKFLKLLRGTKS